MLLCILGVQSWCCVSNISHVDRLVVTNSSLSLCVFCISRWHLFSFLVFHAQIGPFLPLLLLASCEIYRGSVFQQEELLRISAARFLECDPLLCQLCSVGCRNFKSRLSEQRNRFVLITPSACSMAALQRQRSFRAPVQTRHRICPFAR
jgi:hypothetical protein